MSRSRKIRHKVASFPSFMGLGDSMTRDEAVSRIKSALSESITHPEAQRLIGLFSITPEELAEAGISYEILKVLERRALFI